MEKGVNVDIIDDSLKIGCRGTRLGAGDPQADKDRPRKRPALDQPLSPVSATPSISCFWPIRKMMMAGITAMVAAAINSAHCEEY